MVEDKMVTIPADEYAKLITRYQESLALSSPVPTAIGNNVALSLLPPSGSSIQVPLII